MMRSSLAHAGSQSLAGTKPLPKQTLAACPTALLPSSSLQHSGLPCRRSSNADASGCRHRRASSKRDVRVQVAQMSGRQQQQQQQQQDARDLESARALTRRFFEHINRRDVSGLMDMLAPEVVYTNKALQVQHVGKQAVTRFYGQVLSSIPHSAALVLDEVAVSAAPEPPMQALRGSHPPDSRRVSVKWHLEIGGMLVLGSAGVGLMRVEPSRGCILSLQDSPQPSIQLLLPALTLVTPAIDALHPVWQPVMNIITGRALDSGHVVEPFQGFAAGAAGTLGGMMPSPPSLLPWVTDLYGGGNNNNTSNNNSNNRPTTNSTTNSPPAPGPRNTSPTARGASPPTLTMPRSSGSSGSSPARSSTPASSPASRPASTPAPQGRATSPTAQASAAAAAAAPSPPRTSSPSPPPAAKPPTTTTASTATTASKKASKPVAMRGLQSSSPEPSSTPGPQTNVTPVTRASTVVVDEDDVVALEMSEEEETVVQASFYDISATPDLSGVWEKDAEGSQPEAYERMLDVLQLGGLQRVTARLIEGMEIKHKGDAFSVSFLTVVPFFKVTEAIKIDSTVKLMRRDLKPGSQTAFAQRINSGVRVTFEWGNPAGGTLTEEYVLVRNGGDGTPGEMTVTSHLEVGGKVADVVQLYRCSGKGRDELLKESRERNKSFESVLAQQKDKWGK